MKSILPVALLAVVLPTAAAAQTEAPTFTGPRIGIQAGWNQGQNKRVPIGPERESDKKSGVVVRGSLGYDAPIGEHAIIGAEIGLATGGKDIVSSNAAGRYVTNPGIALDATARLGFKPVDKLLIYGKGGWAFQRVKTGFTAPTGSFQRSNSEHGILFGGGAEVAVTRNIAIRAEFDRVSFSDRYARNRALAGLNFRF